LLLFDDLLGFGSEKCGLSPLSTAAAVDGGFYPLALEIDAFYSYLIVQLIICFGLLMLLSTRGRGIQPVVCLLTWLSSFC
jgi:hypothetical protein